MPFSLWVRSALYLLGPCHQLAAQEDLLPSQASHLQLEPQLLGPFSLQCRPPLQVEILQIIQGPRYLLQDLVPYRTHHLVAQQVRSSLHFPGLKHGQRRLLLQALLLLLRYQPSHRVFLSALEVIVLIDQFLFPWFPKIIKSAVVQYEVSAIGYK